jgi:hypothetical protein
MNWWISNGHLIGRARNSQCGGYYGQLTKLGYKREREAWAESNQELLKLDEIDRVIVTAPKTRLALCVSGAIYRWNRWSSRKLARTPEEMEGLTEYLRGLCEEPSIYRIDQPTLKVRFHMVSMYSDLFVTVKWDPITHKARFVEENRPERIKAQESTFYRWSKTLNIVDYDKKRGYILTADGKAYNVFGYNYKTRKIGYQRLEMAKMPRKSANF